MRVLWWNSKVIIEEAVYRILSATPPPTPLLYTAFVVAPYRTKGGKFTPFFRNIFNDDPQFLALFR